MHRDLSRKRATLKKVNTCHRIFVLESDGASFSYTYEKSEENDNKHDMEHDSSALRLVKQSFLKNNVCTLLNRLVWGPRGKVYQGKKNLAHRVRKLTGVTDFQAVTS